VVQGEEREANGEILIHNEPEDIQYLEMHELVAKDHPALDLAEKLFCTLGIIWVGLRA
jgi:hypothetical protein